MHTITHDSFNRPDSIEWRHRGHTVQQNGHPFSADDRYLIWDRTGSLVGEAPSLRAARRCIDSLR